ncbi:MAG: SPOR domain-containing protein [Proteobacteria bacterium]|nr:SPOR domain-containing protein [Pseudomonadota bacterium]
MGRKQVIFIFFLFLIGAAVIFAMGIKVGEYLFENECQSILEESTKKASAQDKKTEEVKPAEENTTTEAKTSEVKEAAVQPLEPENKTKIEKSSSNLGIKEITNEIKGKYTIQISSYQDELEAQQASYKLYSDGFKLAYYMESQIPNKGIWYRVGIGFFKKRESARIFAEMLKKQGKIESYIIRKID